jgi:hypothetical protein
VATVEDSLVERLALPARRILRCRFKRLSPEV